MTPQYPPISAFKTSEKFSRILEGASTICLILFVLFCNFSISIAQAAAYFGVSVWLIQTYRKQNWNKLSFPLSEPFSFFLLAAGLATITAIDVGLSLSGFKKLIKIVIFFWVVNALITARPLEILGTLAKRLRLVKIKEYFFSNKGVGAGNVLVRLLIFAGVVSAGVGIAQAMAHPDGLWNRYGVHGSLSNLMTYAQLLMLITCLGLAKALLGPLRSRVWIGLGLGLMIFAIVLTQNRQSWLGLFLAITFLLFYKKRIYALIPPLLAIIVFILAPQPLKDRIKTMADMNDYSMNERVLMWKAGWNIVKDHPLTGCGFKCQLVIADRYPEHVILQKYTHMHSSSVQLAVDTGAIGLCAWLSIWVVYFVQLTRRSKQIPTDADERWVIFGSAAAVIAFLVAGMFENNFYDSEIIILMYFIMALPFTVSIPSTVTCKESL